MIRRAASERRSERAKSEPIELRRRVMSAWWCVSFALFIVLSIGVTAIGGPTPALALAQGLNRTAAASADEWRTERDHWYRFTLDDQPCGWMRNQRQISADGAMQRTISESLVRLGRGGQSVEIEVRLQFDETPRNEPRAAELRQKTGQEPIEQRFRFDPENRSRVTITSTQGGRVVESTATLPDEPWLTPIGAETAAALRRASGTKSFSLRTIDLVSGLKIAERTFARQEDGTFMHNGRAHPTTRWTVTDSLVPFPTVEEWSSDEVMVKSLTTLAMGRLALTLADRATALASLNGPSVELMVQTLVKPDRAVSNPLAVAKARFRVRALNGELPEWPSTGAQRVVREAPNALVIEVDESVTSQATEAERSDARYRDASVTIDTTDEAIRALARRSVASLADASDQARADAMRRTVHRHIQRKGMSTAFATASETVRARVGDCTEHAVLLAALLRAEGIPARVVTGLVYCSEFGGERDVFGWHMWTQALIDGAWLDYDATLPGTRRFHALHLATGTSAQEQGAMDSEWTALVNLIGNVAIEVQQTTPRESADGR